MTTMSHQTVRLGKGRHESPDPGEVCVMELASMLAGERFTDHPAAVSPVLAAFLRGYNDTVEDARRQTLIPWAAACVGTGPSDEAAEDERRRLIAAHPGGPLHRVFAWFWVREGATVDESGCQHIGRMLGCRAARRDHDRRHAEVRALVDALVAAGRHDRPGAAPGPHERTSGHGAHDRSGHQHCA